MAKKHVSKVGFGLGIGSLAAAAAGAYYLYGTASGGRQRKMIRGWALKIRGEVLERLEEMKVVNEKVYHQAVDAVAKKYRGVRSIDKKELDALVKDMKKHWGNIRKRIEGGSK